MRWYGALLGNFILLSVLFYKQPKFTSLLSDIFIFTFLGSAIGKLGCLFSGHGCYGIPTDLSWGMKFIYGSAPSTMPVHPTPAYDSIVFFTAFLLGIIMNKVKFSKQTNVLTILAFTCFLEFAIECLRPNPEILFGLNAGQIGYTLLFISTLLIILIHKRYANVLSC